MKQREYTSAAVRIGGLPVMDPQTLETLEYDALCERLAGHSQSPLGRARALDLVPSVDPKEVALGLGRTTEAARFLNEHGRFGLGGLAEPEPLLGRIRVFGAVLEAAELLDVARYIESALALRHTFEDLAAEFPLLAAVARALPDLSRPLAEIRAKILPTGWDPLESTCRHASLSIL